LGFLLELEDGWCHNPHLSTPREEALISEQAGFTRVAVVQTWGNAPQEINITLTNYEFTQTKESDKVAASVAGPALCICLAPVLGAPRYFDDQYEISADVTAYRNGRLVFKETVTEKAHSTANVMEAGSANFKAELEQLNLHNLVATVVNRWNKRWTRECLTSRVKADLLTPIFG
jgi:hypothetical protein